MLVRRNSKPIFKSCLFNFQENPSMNWTLVSTRCRGSAEFAPGWAKKELPPDGVTDTRMMGRPESAGPDPEQVGPATVGLVGELLAAHKPMELGWKFWSSGKNPSANRFQPRRISFNFVGEKTCT